MIDYEIMQKLKQRDEQGFSMLIDRYVNYVSAIICNVSRGRLRVEDVEELSADVFLAIWNAGERLREDAPIKPYLAAAARNMTITRLRKHCPEMVPFDEEILVAAKDAQPGALVEAREEQERLYEAFSRFGEPDREILIRRYCFGERVHLIARRLGIKPETAKTKLRRCRERLQMILREGGYRDEKE